MKPTQPADSPLAVPVYGVILAAGKGTRMKSKTIKVLHKIGGMTLLDHVLMSVRAVTNTQPIIVIGNDSDKVREAVAERGVCVTQAEQLGTGHAVMQAEQAVPDTYPPHQVIVCYADMPLLTAETMRRLIAEQANSGAAIAQLTVVNQNPRGFGRVVRDADSNVTAVVEEVACTPEQLKITELNAGAYCFDGVWLWRALKRLQPNPQKGEYFLTDLIAFAVNDGRIVRAVQTDDLDETVGINTRVDLADAAIMLRKRINKMHMLNGVTLVDPATTYIDATVTIGQDTTVLANCHPRDQSHIGEDCVIGPASFVRDSFIGSRVRVSQSVIEESRMDDDSDIGPYSHLRAGTHIRSRVHIGNFAEVKNSDIGERSQMGHFSYVGDATVGEGVNLSAGIITANYDGKNKHRTVIEDDAFIGSDTTLRAPVRIGKRARTGAGSVVTHDVNEAETVVGVPAKPFTKTS